MNIAFSINNAYVGHLLVTLYSLIVNNPKEAIVVHILSSDLTKDSKLAIDQLKKLGKKIDIKHYSIDKSDFEKMPITMDYIALETYYRLVLPQVLPREVKTVLYLDADIVIDGSLKDLFKVNLDDVYAAGVPDIYLNGDSNYKEQIGMGDNLYVNAGVCLFNLDRMRRDDIVPRLIEATKSPNHKFQDQDAINVVLSGQVTPLDDKFNYQLKDKQYQELSSDKKLILHYSGSLKPWNRDRLYDVYLEIYDNYKLRTASFLHKHAKNFKYGLLKYSTDNVGDSIQGIAARKFLPQVDYYFERDNMDATKTHPGESVKVIINGWWGDGPENWPPLDQNLDILPVSMYVEDRIQAEFAKPRSKQLLNTIGPIGARSQGTKEFLDSIGVESYFSGCLTLTINPDPRIKKRDYILAVDVSDDVYEVMQQQSGGRKVIRLDVMRAITDDADEQYRLGEFYLYLYQSAHSVVTTRLHTMMPCLALGTPVLFINDILDDDNVRFSGLAELAHTMRSEEYIANPENFSISRPPANSKDFMKIRKQLEKTCSNFTGFMSKESFMTRPLDELLSDTNLHQALLGGIDELGKLRIKTGRLEEMLKHKTSHVEELAHENAIMKAQLDTAHVRIANKLARWARGVSRIKERKRNK